MKEVPVIFVDGTPVPDGDKTYFVCSVLMVNTDKNGTYILAAFPHLFNTEPILDELRAMSGDQRKAVVALGLDWHGTLEELINAAKELA